MPTNSNLSTVTVSFDNVQPVADAGGNQSALVYETVSLDGSGSFDAHLDPLTYGWSLIAQPAGSTAALARVAPATTCSLAELPAATVVSRVVGGRPAASPPA